MKRKMKMLWAVILAIVVFLTGVPELDTLAADKTSVPEETKTGIVTSWHGCGTDADGWWIASEVNVNIAVPVLQTKLKMGEIGLTLYVPKGQMQDGKYSIELFIMKGNDEVYGIKSDFAVKAGYFTDYNNSVITVVEDNDILYMHVKCSYDSKNTIDGENINLRVKTHSDASSDSGDIGIFNVYILDYVYGFNNVDLSKAGAFVREYATGKDWPAKVGNIGRALYIENLPEVIYVGEKIKLSCASDVYKIQKLKYSSSKKSVAKVSSKGVLTALKSGTVTITVTDKSNNAKVSRWVTVKKPYMSFMADKSRLAEGAKYTFKCIANGYTSKKVTWTSSNTKVGKIDAETGVFEAKQAGKTKITASDSAGYSHSCTVEVFKIDNAALKSYIIMHDSDDAPDEIEQLTYEHLFKVYDSVYAMFGDGNYHYIDVFFEHASPNSGVAAYACSGSEPNHYEIHMFIETLTRNTDDVDSITHELIHTAQAYDFVDSDGNDVTWLGEGLTDYGRYKLGLHNLEAGWRLGMYEEGQHYTDSYTTTASFIKYIEEQINANFARELNDVFREGTYSDDFWTASTGYTLEGLWTMYKAYSANYTKERLTVGTMAPDFTLRKLENGTYNKKVSLSDYRGKAVIVDFWGTWCGPCKDELPYLQKLIDRYGDKLVVLCLSDDYPEEDQSYIDANGYTFIDLYDKEYAVGTELYNITGWPSTFLIDREGVIVRNEGVNDWNYDDFCRVIDEILRK